LEYPLKKSRKKMLDIDPIKYNLRAKATIIEKQKPSPQ
jgi:hypothetical protein